MRGTKTGAHRAAWSLYRGEELSSDALVCHRCDTPGCVNPDHLFVADQSENMADMHRKGRHATPHGDGHWNASLCADGVVAIRADPRPAHEIAREYGVKPPAIFKIKTRRTWKHV